MLGLDSKKVMLEEYDGEWHLYFNDESKFIKNILGDSVMDIQHFGSTSIRKGKDITTHLIHVVEYGKNNRIHNIKFRDALKNNPALIKEYEQLKEDLAKKYPDSREKYTAGKGKFILDVVSKQ